MHIFKILIVKKKLVDFYEDDDDDNDHDHDNTGVLKNKQKKRFQPIRILDDSSQSESELEAKTGKNNENLDKSFLKTETAKQTKFSDYGVLDLNEKKTLIQALEKCNHNLETIVKVITCGKISVTIY